MRIYRVSLILVVVCSLLILGAPASPHKASAQAIDEGDHLSAETLQQLARVRRVTAKFHVVEEAVDEGYVKDLYITGEGRHYVKLSLLDNNFNLEEPESLLYAPATGEDGLQLAGVEYIIPKCGHPNFPAPACSLTKPTVGFEGAEWEVENLPSGSFWVMRAWVWMHNPDGMFAGSNPRIP